MLTLNLKKEWFDKIKSGEKTHEYRLQTKFWKQRLKPNIVFDFLNGHYTKVEDETYGGIKSGDIVCFALGYPPKNDKSRRLYAEILNITSDVDGRETDLNIDEPVFDIEFKLIKEQ